MANKIRRYLKLANTVFFKTSLLAFSGVYFSLLPTTAMSVTLENSGDKATVIIVAEGAGRRDYAVDTKKSITFCLKGCFITLANGERYALNGTEVIEISGNRLGFH